MIVCPSKMVMNRVHLIMLQFLLLLSFCCVFMPVGSSSSTTSTVLSGISPTPGPVAPSKSTSPASLATAVSNSATSRSVSTTIRSEVTVMPSATSIHSTYIRTDKPAFTTSATSAPSSGRKFDGLSFFGGMILGASICVILLFSVKYYRAKKRSYHSL